MLRGHARLIDLAPVANIGRLLDGTITFWSAGAEHLYGWSKEEVVGRRTHDLFQTKFPDGECLETIVEKVRQGEAWSGELEHSTRSGQRVKVQSYWLGELDDAGNMIGLLESNLDVTDRKRAEQALQESEKRFRSFVMATAHVIWSMNLRGEVDKPIPSWNAFTGQSDQEALGFGFLNAIHPDDRSHVVEAWKQASAAKRVYEAEYRLRTASGQWRHILARGVPVLDSKNEVVEYVGTSMDITERKKAEAQLKNHARHLEETVAEKTAELRHTLRQLESFSYSLSHDIRAPLRAIRNYTQMAMTQTDEAARRELLQRCVASAQRLDQLVQDVLALTKLSRDEIPLATVDLVQLINQILADHPEFQPPGAEITIENPIMRVLGNQASLTQCFTNLIGNAVKFVRPGVAPKVRIHAKVLDSRIRVYVEDKGIGIEREAQEKLFGMFSRVSGDRSYEGTGLGLAIVRTAVERMGGSVGVESEVGEGSRFWIELQKAP